MSTIDDIHETQEILRALSDTQNARINLAVLEDKNIQEINKLKEELANLNKELNIMNLREAAWERLKNIETYNEIKE